MAFFDLAQYDDPRFLLDLSASTAREKSGNPTTVTNASSATHIPLIYGGDVSSVLSNAARVTVSGLELVTPGSFEAWVRESVQGTTSILSTSGTDLLVLNGQKIQFTVNYPSGSAVAEYIVIDGQTYHVVGTIGSDQIMLYVNGEIVDAVELTDQQLLEQPILGTSLIAGQGTGAVLADGLAYYEYPLEEEVILNHYKEGSPDKRLSEHAPATGAAAFVLTDDTASISGLYDTDENMPWDSAEILGLTVEDTLTPEMYDDLSTDGYCLFTIPLDASDNDIIATSKIEWESTGSFVVEVSLDTLTWTTCENKNTVPVLTDNFNGVDKELYVRVSYPINLNEPDAEFKSLRVVFYSDRTLSAIGGPRPVVTVGAVSPAQEEHDFIEMNDAAGLKFNGGTAYIDSIVDGAVFGIRTIEMTVWIPTGTTAMTLVDDDDNFITASMTGSAWSLTGATAVTNGVVGFTPVVGRWNHIVLILNDNISMRNYVTNGDMQTATATNVLVATNLVPDPQMVATGGGNSPSPGTRNVEVQIDPDIPASLMTVRDSTLTNPTQISNAWFAGTSVGDPKRITVTPGTVISAAIRVQTDQDDARVRLSYGWRDAAGASVGVGGNGAYVNLIADTPTVVALEGITVPTGAVTLSFGGIVDTVDGSIAETGATTYWAGAIVTATPKAVAYFDGSTPDFIFDFAWTGTANSSTSTKTGHPVTGFTLASNVIQYQDIDDDGLWITIRSISQVVGADSAYIGAIDGIVPGNQYTFSVDVKTDYATKIALQFSDSTGTAIGTAPITNISAMPGVTQRVSVTATAPALAQKFRLFAYGNDDVVGNEVRYSNFSLSEGTDAIYFDNDSPGAALSGSTSTLYGPQGRIVIGGPDNMRVGYLTYYSDKLTTAEAQALYNALIGKTLTTLSEPAITAVIDSPVAPQFYAHDWSFTGAG